MDGSRCWKFHAGQKQAEVNEISNVCTTRHCSGCKSSGSFLSADYKNQRMSTLRQAMKWCLAKQAKRPMGLDVSFPVCKTVLFLARSEEHTSELQSRLHL